ncbi:MAG: hypothetical protein IKU25_07210 [Clostridia bacterium]|nr:hypothetical protein [Clostridia bacterium]
MELSFKKYMEKTTSGKILCFISVMLAFFVTLWQAYTVLTFNCIQNAETYTYYKIAKIAADNSTLYPSITNLYDNEIYSPGFINYLTMLFKINGGLRFALLCNVALTLLLAFLIYFVASRVFKRRGIGFISVIIFELTLSYTCAVLFLRSELLLSVALFGGFALCLSKFKGRYILAGAVFAYACWINLIALVFIAAAIIYLLLQKYGAHNAFKIVASLVCVVLVIQVSSYYISGYSTFISPVSGKEVMESANDYTNGRYGTQEVFAEGKEGYIPNANSLTFIEKNNYWLSQSSEWISNNFGTYLSQIPNKLFTIYAPDTHYIYSYYLNLPFNGTGVLSTTLGNFFTFNFGALSWVDGVMIFNQFVYWLTLLFAVATTIGFIIVRKHRKALISLWIFPLFSTLIYMIGSAESVMHVIFMPVFIMIAAAGISHTLMRKTRETCLGADVSSTDDNVAEQAAVTETQEAPQAE